MAVPANTSTCNRCGKSKPMSAFSVDASRKNGVRSICRKCTSTRPDKHEWPEDYEPPVSTRWSDAKIADAAKCYATKVDFQRGNLPAYTAAIRSKKGLDHYCAHMDPVNRSWTFDKILEIAQTFKTIKEFRLGDYAAYGAGLRTGRTHELYAHMTRPSDPSDRYIYLIESADKSTVYVGLSAQPDRRYMEHTRSGAERVRRLIEGDHTFTVVDGPMCESDAQEAERSLVKSMAADGVEVLNSNAGGALGALGSVRWDRDSIAAEALKFETATDFARGSPGAYSAAQRRFGGALQFCGHMKRLNYWPEEAIRAEAKKYRTRTEFEKANGSAVNAARRMGIMEDVCAHMPVYGRRPIGASIQRRVGIAA